MRAAVATLALLLAAATSAAASSAKFASAPPGPPGSSALSNLAASPAANATMVKLATLLGGKGYANATCPLVNNASISREVAAVSNKLATVFSAARPKFCATLEALGPAAQCEVVSFVERELSVCISPTGACDAVPPCTNATGTGNQVPPPATDPAGAPLPAALTDARPLPKLPFKGDVLAKEGATYFWWWRAVFNLYTAFPCVSIPGASYLVPAGWTLVDTIFLPQPPETGSGPPLAPPQMFAVILYNPATKSVGVLVRGTVTKSEWVIDLDYKMVEATSVGVNVPGLVHRGFATTYAQTLAPAVDAAIDAYVLAGLATSVTVTGHSLGAGVAQVAAAAVAAKLTAAGAPLTTTVTAVLFAPPNAGDEVFAAYFNAAVNGRRIAFAFDLVPQLPCKGQFACGRDVLVPTGPANGVPPFPYATVGGTVPLGPASMPAQQGYWAGLDRVNLCYFSQEVSTAHICSYNCALSGFAGAADNWCLLHPATPAELTAGNTFCRFPANFYPSAVYPPLADPNVVTFKA